MNISSILITILGIIIILALYVMSRLGQNKVPQHNDTKLPEIKDADGNPFTSILDDIPASDKSDNLNASSLEKTSSKNEVTTENKPEASKKQLVLFISANDEKGLDGSLVKRALIDNGLSLGDKDIYHYNIDDNNQSNSLFRVANGVEPWTLTDEDLDDQMIVGISIVMLLPNFINNNEATQIFLTKADAITQQVNGILKNQHQERLSTADRSDIINS